jgi:hypothetical protein
MGVRAALAYAAALLTLAACMGGTDDGAATDESIPFPSRFDTVDEGAIARFEARPGRTAYFLGWAFEGLPLQNVGEYRTDRAYFLTFSYGSCAPTPCAAPLSVQVFPLEGRNPSRWGPRSRCFRGTFRGVPVGVLPGNWALDLYTRRTTVSISGAPRQVLRAARSLRRASGGSSRATLGRPPSWVSRELARCTRVPLVRAIAE